ncbi:glutathione S-transferase [Phaeovulum sp.]|uniref:glutathione S-transferase n=1 Tax=Phaeovulum sp. TaxID=2934796 RepID=UPI0035685EA4
MGYQLAIGDRSYSSWSLRGWLMFAHGKIEVETKMGRLYSPDFTRLMGEFAPARLAPALRLPEGQVIGETLAIAETLAERHPEAQIWPADATARAVARFMAAEMHAGFGALRNHCAMNLRIAYADCAPGPEVLADLARIEELWSLARRNFAVAGPWLFGRWSAADAFYAPVAARIAGHNLPVGREAAAYVETTLADPAFRQWRAVGLTEGPDQQAYRRDWPTRPWPGPTPLETEACDGPSVNASCPYSGKPVTHFLRMGPHVWGFCNATCRDKTRADPEAWPAFMDMVKKH